LQQRYVTLDLSMMPVPVLFTGWL